MPTSEFLDYEPLRGPKKSGTTEPDSFPDFEFEQKAAPTEIKQGISPSTKVVFAQPLSFLTRGHGVSFAGLFLFTFLVYFRPYEWSPSLMWLSTSAFWVAVVTLVIFVPVQLGLENRLTIRPRAVNAVLLLAVAGILSIPLAADPAKAWTTLLEFLKVVVMFIVMINVVRTPRRLSLLLGLVLLVSFVLSVSAINDYRLGRLGVRGDRIEGALGGLFSNPNDLALHLVTIIPIAFAMFRGTQSLIRKLFLLAVILTMLCGVVATFSRGGFLGLVVIILVLSWKFAGSYRIPFLVFGFLVIAFVLTIAPAAYWSRIATTRDDSARARTDDLKRSLFIAARHPLLGVGMGNYEIYSNLEKVSHNAYTQVAAEMGLPALALYLIFLIATIKSLRRIETAALAAGERSRYYYLSVGLQAGLIGYMVSSTFASVAYLWYAYYLVGYSICLTRFFAAEQGKKTQMAPQTSI